MKPCLCNHFVTVLHVSIKSDPSPPEHDLKVPPKPCLHFTTDLPFGSCSDFFYFLFYETNLTADEPPVFQIPPCSSKETPLTLCCDPPLGQILPLPLGFLFPPLASAQSPTRSIAPNQVRVLTQHDDSSPYVGHGLQPLRDTFLTPIRLTAQEVTEIKDTKGSAINQEITNIQKSHFYIFL